MNGIEIAHVVNDGHVAAFMQLLSKTYQDYAVRPYLCYLTCIVHDNVKYLAATDGVFLIALPTSETLELGDYEGLPYLVKINSDRLYRRVSDLLSQLPKMKRSDFSLNENAYEGRANIINSFSKKEALGTDVLLAHVANDKFVIDMDAPHTHILSRELYEQAADAVGGFFDYVYHADSSKMLGFFNKSGFGFALIMSMKPDCKIKIH